jgi:hypothetical protein
VVEMTGSSRACPSGIFRESARKENHLAQPAERCDSFSPNELHSNAESSPGATTKCAPAPEKDSAIPFADALAELTEARGAFLAGLIRVYMTSSRGLGGIERAIVSVERRNCGECQRLPGR